MYWGLEERLPHVSPETGHDDGERCYVSLHQTVSLIQGMTTLLFEAVNESQSLGKG